MRLAFYDSGAPLRGIVLAFCDTVVAFHDNGAAKRGAGAALSGRRTPQGVSASC